MALTEKQAAKHGFAFAIEGLRAPSNPNTELYEGNLTIDNHTERFQGKSKDEVLKAVEQRLRSAGKLREDGDPED